MHATDPHKAVIYQWHQLIQQACDYAVISLDDDIQSYLLLTLIRYIHDDQLAENAITMSFKINDTLPRDQRIQALKSRAEHCLILAGMFPSYIDRQSLRISHYIQLGIDSYAELSQLMFDHDKLIYQQLSEDFVKLIDVLYTVRVFNGAPMLPLIQAMELWSDTGSKTAFRTLTINRQSIPLTEHLSNSQYKH